MGIRLSLPKLDVHSPSAIDQPGNAMTLILDIREALGDFQVAFKAVGMCIYISYATGY